MPLLSVVRQLYLLDGALMGKVSGADEPIRIRARPATLVGQVPSMLDVHPFT